MRLNRQLQGVFRDDLRRNMDTYRDPLIHNLVPQARRLGGGKWGGEAEEGEVGGRPCLIRETPNTSTLDIDIDPELPRARTSQNTEKSTSETVKTLP